MDWPVLRRWLHALKPASWPKLVVPTILGQVLGASAAGGVSLGALAIGALFTVADLSFVVLLNDWGDREVDAIKRRMFPDGCSPKTIPDGILSAPAVLAGGLVAGSVAVATATVGGLWLDRPGLGVAALALLGLFVAYTLPPLRLNYRGGGELLEMLGVGVALPLFHAYLQSGQVPVAAAGLLPGFAMMSLSSAIASGLADEQSDRAGGKTTVVTLVGNPLARRLVQACVALGIALWLLAPLTGAVSLLPAWGAAMVALWHRRRLLSDSEAARTNAFAEQKVYKGHLHDAIWRSALVAATLLGFETFV
jgi:1,4-dihydroxy-2-naphthoate octaprenyltransferase/chlorophyll synthase